MPPARKTSSPTRKPAAKPAARTRGAAPPRARAHRSNAAWAPRLPLLEQHHVDLIGLGLVAAGIFLAFPLYLGWDGGAAGGGLVDALAWIAGELRYGAPVLLVACGALLVLSPVLPTMRPFRAGAFCLVTALLLGLSAGTLGLGPSGAHGAFWVRSTFEPRGGITGEAIFWVTHTLLGTIGSHIVCVFLLTAGVLLLTGASIAGVLRATATVAADATGVLRTVAPATRREPDHTGGGGPARDPWGDEEFPTESPFAGEEPVKATRARAKKVTPPDAAEVDVIIRPAERTTQLDGAVRYPDLFGDEPMPVLRGRPATPPEPPPAVPAPSDEVMDVLDDPFEDAPVPPPPVRVRPKPAPAAVAPEDDEDRAPVDPLHEDPTAVVPIGEQARLPLGEGEIEWTRPGAALLTRSAPDQQRPDLRGQEATAQRLIEALAHFNVEAKVIGTVSGPHITRYELKLAPGIKMSKVAQMKDDLAYALAATEIRILAPIPGKTAVGVEVPNVNRQMVTLGDVYGPPPKGSSPLTVWLGKDVSGASIHADLAKMPHLLVAGTTGAGKSGCINAMLSSILLRATPEEVRLILVDPKQVELNHYEAVPHLLTPVITSPRSAANALQNLVREMEWRYGIMSMARTRSLPELNKYRLENEQDPLPYILCVIDELADLMMVAPGDVEDSIIRIAQKARAVGIHLVLATQSPRVDVITGMIKANVPSRIAFSVSSQTDSRVILDQNGAESLLGMGDMLFSAVGSSKLHRIQGAYIDEPQIAKLTEFWAEQGEPEIREDLLAEVVAEEPEKKTDDDGFDPDEDPLLGEAIALVVEMGTASTSMLQRRLRLGYTRAGRLVDMLERRGIISGYEGSKPRTVLVSAGDLPRVLAALAEGGGGGEADGADAAAEPPDTVLPERPDPVEILDT
ncbi:DNA translocase FtsK [Paraconexibacter antarcticus]|uniref:DNA translocase FtsK n=1 Tax=Paraconexibacter antarcticus TaxID=2949664 RepID=A0ABY5DPY8_9ACTN|nr:DNA translocase FtsK [Paraconexibacter antarcticus]UTI62775.1 DNA translocase FtsK [Paraconexibacter antarcticus]